MPTSTPSVSLRRRCTWGERLDVEVEALMVMRRGEAMDDGAVGVVRGARAVYLVGDQPLHLRSVLKGTPLWEAITQVLADGGVVAATGGSAGGDVRPDGRPARRRVHAGARTDRWLGARDRGRDMVNRPAAPHAEVGQHACRRATERRSVGAHRARVGNTSARSPSTATCP